MSYFNAGDWLTMLLYLGAVIVLGLWFGKDQHNTRDYFLGSRNIPWWAVGLSIVATETSALTFIAVPAIAYGTNLAFLQIIIGYVIARVILAIVLVPHYFRGEIYSPYQLITQAFGPASGRLASGFFLISGVLAAGVRIYVTCIPLRLLLGIDILAAILLFVVLSLAYTYVGGIKAVVWTDALQFALFIGGGLFVLAYIPCQLPDGWVGALREAKAAGKLHALNLSFSWSMPINLWMGLVGATVQVMSSHGADQLIVQRVLTCRSVADGRKALLLSAVVIFPLFVLFLLTGTLLWVYYQHYAPAIPLPSGTTGFTKNDYVFPIFILTALPNGLKGFLMVAILSAAMSSVSSALSALASVTVMDLWPRREKAGQGTKHQLRLSRVVTLFWAAGLIIVAWGTRRAEYVLNTAFSLSGLTSGALLGGVGLAVFWRHGRAAPIMAGMTVSLAVMTLIRVYLSARIAWPWYTLIGLVVTVAVAWIVRALIQPPPAEPP